jgi:hypothetical protein
MRLSELTISELLALANILLRIADEIPKNEPQRVREARNEIAYVLKLVTEKGEGRLSPAPLYH